MKKYLYFLLKWAACFVACFVITYVFVFFGGWKLFESGDAFLIEIGFAGILSIFVVILLEVIAKLEKRIADLEERIKKLEDNK